MAIDLSLLADKLKRYRKQFQTSIEELSRTTGIPADDLISFENADKTPSGDDILIIADYYKCDYNFFISNQRIAPFEQTENLFRLHGNEISINDRWAIQEFLYLSDCETFLQKSLNIRPILDFKFKKRGNIFKKHGEEAARELRSHLGYKKNEIPLDIFSDFRNMGIHVFRRKLENSNISGLYVNHPAAGKCILINYSEDIYRQSFTAAHELGHALLDEDQEFIISFIKWEKKDLSEIRANTFASCYLLPKSFLESIPNVQDWNSDKATLWANKLKISTMALAIALRNHGLVNQENYNIIKSAKVLKDAKRDPELPVNLTGKFRDKKEDLLKKGLSSYYVNLCLKAYQQNIVSASRIGEMLLVDENMINNILELFGGKIDYGS